MNNHSLKRDVGTAGGGSVIPSGTTLTELKAIVAAFINKKRAALDREELANMFNGIFTYLTDSLTSVFNYPQTLSLTLFGAATNVTDGTSTQFWIVPAEYDGKTISAGVFRTVSGAGTTTLTVTKNGVATAMVETLITSAAASASADSFTVATGDRITFVTSATSGTVTGLSATLTIT